MGSKYYERLFEADGFDLTQEQKDLIAISDSFREINKSRIASELYLIKNLQRAVDKTITANDNLATSNNKHSTQMRWLTAVMAVAVVVQAITAAVALYFVLDK